MSKKTSFDKFRMDVINFRYKIDYILLNEKCPYLLFIINYFSRKKQIIS
jgi:hypothetical protein